MRRTTTEPFALLGLAPGASTADVRRAFRRRVREAHPDHGGDPAAFRALWAAYRAAAALAGRDVPADPAAARAASPRPPAGYAWCFEPLEPLEPLTPPRPHPAGGPRRVRGTERTGASPGTDGAFAAVLDRELARVG